MSYPWKTQVVWGPGAPVEPHRSNIVLVHLPPLIQQNKTDGIIDIVSTNPDGSRTVVRNWDSEASAQNWITNVVGPVGPVSTTIIPPA